MGINKTDGYPVGSHFRALCASEHGCQEGAMESGDRSESEELSELSTVTCTEEFTDFVPLPAINYKVLFSVSVAGIGVLNGEFGEDGAVRFHLPAVYIVISRPVKQEDIPSLNITGEAKFANLEWKYMVQMRFRVGTAQSDTDRVVDGDLFELGNRCSPIVVRIGDENIRRVRIEMKFVEKLHDFLPKFDCGDIALKFGDETLKVYKALLSLHSNYMARKLRFAEEGAVINMGDSGAEDFKELLYQIYPTKRPIWANLKGLTRAAIGFRAEGIIDRITSYIVNYESLPNVIEELVYKAEQDGYWVDIVRNGLNPELEYGPAIYNSVILPAVAKAKSSPVGLPAREPFFKAVNFRKPPSENNENNTEVMVVCGTRLYVNKGIMKVNNDTMFGRSNAGEMMVQVSSELAEECGKIKKSPLYVVEALLRHIHPKNEPIDDILLRAMLVLCSTHRMEHVMKSLENYLIQEPPTSPERFLEQFELADKYDLENLLLRNLHRIENSCRHFAMPMIKHDNFKKLKEETKNQILDRFCSGWGVGGCKKTDCPRMPKPLTCKQVLSRGTCAVPLIVRELKTNISLPRRTDPEEVLRNQEVDSYAAFGSSEEIN